MTAPLRRQTGPIRARHLVTLLALFAPPLGFAIGLALLYGSDPRFAWVGSPVRYPAELWVMVVCGTLATFGGVGDWIWHRTYVTVGPREHRAHLLALGTGGVPLFGLMAAASLMPSAGARELLIPVLVVVLYTTVLICYDEFVFHRRCRPLEQLFHRLLVFGNGLAWLAWAHWCFVGARG